jgi:hypothetical protein
MVDFLLKHNDIKKNDPEHLGNLVQNGHMYLMNTHMERAANRFDYWHASGYICNLGDLVAKGEHVFKAWFTKWESNGARDNTNIREFKNTILADTISKFNNISSTTAGNPFMKPVKLENEVGEIQVRLLYIFFTGIYLLINIINSPPSVYRAPGPPSLATQAPTASHMPPPPLAGGYMQVPPISSALRSIFGFARQTRPPMGIPAPGPPSPATRASITSGMPPTPFASGSTQSPPISSPCGSVFSFVRQTRPLSGIPAPGPPSPSTRVSTASRMPPPLLAGGYTQVQPISSPSGSIFDYVRQTAPPRAFRLQAPPALQLRPLPYPAYLHHR